MTRCNKKHGQQSVDTNKKQQLQRDKNRSDRHSITIRQEIHVLHQRKETSSAYQQQHRKE